MGRIVKKSLSHLPRVIVETSFVYFLHHLRGQNRGEFVGHPGREVSSYQAEKEKCQVAGNIVIYLGQSEPRSRGCSSCCPGGSRGTPSGRTGL